MVVVVVVVDFAVPVNHGVKIKDSEKINKYLDLVRLLKKYVKNDGDGNTNYI